MSKLTVLGAAAILASAIGSPAIAQQVIYNPGYCAQFYPNANCQNKGPNNPYTGSYQRNRAYYNTHGAYERQARTYYEQRRGQTGFWPGDVAANAVGGAIGTAGAIAGSAVNTAGAIATAPFRAADANTYAYGNGYYDWNHQTYAQRNGFVCTPGTYFKGEDGRRHVCQ